MPRGRSVARGRELRRAAEAGDSSAEEGKGEKEGEAEGNLRGVDVRVDDEEEGEDGGESGETRVLILPVMCESNKMIAVLKACRLSDVNNWPSIDVTNCRKAARLSGMEKEPWWKETGNVGSEAGGKRYGDRKR